MNQSKNRTPLYALIQGLYWMIFCVVVAYASVYLLARGLSAASLGILMATANVVGAIFQPLVADFQDRTERVSLSRLVILVSLPAVAVSLVLPRTDGLASSLLYVALISLTYVLMPLVNSIGMYFTNAGFKSNWGMARAMGSLAFAVLSHFLGLRIASSGPGFLPLVTAVLFGLLCLVMLFTDTRILPQVHATEEEAARLSPAVLSRKYPGFLTVLIGMFLIFGFHGVTNTYLIQIMTHLGGGAPEMGTAIGIGAILELPAMFFFAQLESRLGAARIIKIAGVFWVLKALAYSLAGSVDQIYWAQIFQGLSFAPFMPALVYYSNDRMSSRDKVKGQAMMTTANTLGGVLGSLAGGFVLERLGVPGMLLVGIGLALAGAAALFRGIRAGRRAVDNFTG